MLSRFAGRLAPLFLALAAVAAALVIAACGGDDEEDVQAILDRAFDQPIGSADVSLNVDAQVEGSPQLAEPIRAQLSGPYRSGEEDTLPSFDWDASVSGGEASQVPPVGLISTGDNVFVELQGTAYEVGEESVRQALAERPDDEEQGFAAFGVDPREWIVNGQNEGDEEVAGVETTHVSGSIDVAKMLEDVNRVAQEAGGSVGGQTPPALTPEQIAQAEEVVGEPRFDLFAGKDDGKIRRLTANVDFTVPEDQRAGAGGAEGGSVSFALEFANVGGDQEITPPSDARPIADLAQQITGLGGLSGGGSGGGSDSPTTPSPGAGAGESPGAGGAGSPEAERFREYGECLQDADPQDQEELAECNELLQQ